jgi:hypothetical protein
VPDDEGAPLGEVVDVVDDHLVRQDRLDSRPLGLDALMPAAIVGLRNLA